MLFWILIPQQVRVCRAVQVLPMTAFHAPPTVPEGTEQAGNFWHFSFYFLGFFKMVGLTNSKYCIALPEITTDKDHFNSFSVP